MNIVLKKKKKKKFTIELVNLYQFSSRSTTNITLLFTTINLPYQQM